MYTTNLTEGYFDNDIQNECFNYTLRGKVVFSLCRHSYIRISIGVRLVPGVTDE